MSMTPNHLLAIDQGTTSTRAILFNAELAIVADAQAELPQHYPAPGQVEHDPEEIWSATLAVGREAIAKSGLAPAAIAAIGITNQRETTVIWERATGRPIHPAIVWQDRRTAPWCRLMEVEVGNQAVGERTGLLFDPYFSASKIAHILDCVSGARQAAENGALAFGTIDTFLLWRLTQGRQHLTDATNAARTLCFNLDRQDWDDDLLRAFRIPRALLPEVRDCAADFGVADAAHFGAPIPIRGIAGDQHAATVGQACFAPGQIKSTFGTGTFVVVNTGKRRVRSQNRLLTTLAYRLGGQPTYALEGSVFVSGAAVQWLRDCLKAIARSGDSEALARSVPDTGGVYLVPAFSGLGAPWWKPEARGAILGLTRNSGLPEIVRAALEATAYQTRDLMAAMAADGATATSLRVDGGMAVNDWLMQFLADQLALPVERPAVTETTALGAAALAGLGAGVFGSLDEISARWRLDRRFVPAPDLREAQRLYQGWQAAVQQVVGTGHTV